MLLLYGKCGKPILRVTKVTGKQDGAKWKESIKNDGNDMKAHNYILNPGASTSATIGCVFTNCQDVVVEQNLIDILTVNNAVKHNGCATFKTFNNQKSPGVFLPGYNSTTTLYDADLVTDAQDVLLPV